MPAPLVPARLAFAADGTPYSAEFGDVYHSAEGGLGQARHVFLAGNGLPERWRGRRSFTILETGFGLGVNFLATWQAWRDDAQRCERLNFVSVEKHPLTASDLSAALKKYPELDPKPLLDFWPLLVPGMHRLAFGGVVLTLLFADIAAVREFDLTANAFYLDGFAPDRNPDMWTPQLMRSLARLAAPGATAATWSVAAGVRQSLERTGFEVEKTKGFGSKREMLFCRYTGKTNTKIEEKNKTAIVVGAGIAGAAASERLTARGWDVTVIERHDKPAMEASGNPAGIFHPVISPDDSVFARVTRAAYCYLLSHWKSLGGLRWSQCGVLQLPRDEDERRSQLRALEPLAYPRDYVFEDGGLLFPRAGWVSPKSLVDALLRCRTIFSREVHSIEKSKDWIAKDKAGKTIASAPVLILANSADAVRLAPQKHMRLRRVRGQLTLVPAIAGLDRVLIRGGFAIPGIDGVSAVGASFDIDDEDAEVRAESHEGNLERLEQLVPGASKGLKVSQLQGRVGFRSVVPDRLPVIGRLGDGLYGAFAYGSRGLLWAGLGGELLASLIEGEPLPLERKLASALHPERFSVRQSRKNSQGRSSLMSS
jgi:tRNA 5-methylaminomethyl-2-thiouridine biosynthesis bifunctional protein